MSTPDSTTWFAAFTFFLPTYMESPFFTQGRVGGLQIIPCSITTCFVPFTTVYFLFALISVCMWMCVSLCRIIWHHLWERLNFAHKKSHFPPRFFSYALVTIPTTPTLLFDNPGRVSSSGCVCVCKCLCVFTRVCVNVCCWRLEVLRPYSFLLQMITLFPRGNRYNYGFHVLMIFIVAFRACDLQSSGSFSHNVKLSDKSFLLCRSRKCCRVSMVTSRHTSPSYIE